VIDNLRQAYNRGGVKAYWTTLLELLQAMETASVYVSPFDRASIYARLDDHEQALRWLEKGLVQRIRYIPYVNVDPVFDNLRADPRFQQLMRRIGLPSS
jgi:hypothetical protein